MDVSSILVWNVRGLNKKSHRDAVRDPIASHCPEVICLQETKIQNMSTRVLLATLGTELDCHVCLPAEGMRGGILIAWRGDVIQMITTRVDTYSASVLFQNSNGDQWWFTGVCRPHLDAHKLLFLEEMHTIHAACPGPRLIAGDFNLIYRATDKNNTNIDRALMGRFRRTLNQLQLKQIELIGRRFTWSNERDSLTLVRLDRAFCTTDWEAIYPDHALLSTTAGTSDHCPLTLSLRSHIRGKRRFHFESFWPCLDGFHEAVQVA